MPHATEEELDALGAHALKRVKVGQVIGLGTGHAASAFIRALGASGIKVRGVPTSNASAKLGSEVGIEVDTLGDVTKIDTDFDGADEVDSRLNLIKGYAGALVREKIVAASSRRFVVLIGEEKLVPRLGTRGNLPVEIVPFALPLVTRKVTTLGLKPKLREIDGKTFQTVGLPPVKNSKFKKSHPQLILPPPWGRTRSAGRSRLKVSSPSTTRLRYALPGSPKAGRTLCSHWSRRPSLWHASNDQRG